MSRSVNRVTLLGNLGQDGNLSYTPGGSAILKFSLATSRRWQDKNTNEWREETEWSNCTQFGKQAEAIAPHVKKGGRLYVEGRLKTRSWEKDGQKHFATEIIVDEIVFCDGAKSSNVGQTTAGAVTSSRPVRRQPPQEDPISENIEDSDIPF
jgi:single-strand DNA-binding protein